MTRHGTGSSIQRYVVPGRIHKQFMDVSAPVGSRKIDCILTAHRLDWFLRSDRLPHPLIFHRTSPSNGLVFVGPELRPILKRCRTTEGYRRPRSDFPLWFAPAAASPIPSLRSVGELASRLQFQDRHEIFRVYGRLLLRMLVISQQALVGSFRNGFDSFLYGG